ncbi:methyltransferase domain-containing protein [Patescibacteria group bacterium]|nr:methyltransferase domain-containing protein [Patescibacteria group bacterium]
MRKELKDIINKNFFNPNWYSITINPYYIARSGLFKKIRKFSLNEFSGKIILDVGCGNRPYKNLFKNYKKYIGIDIDGGGHSDVAKSADEYFDGERIPFNNESFDVVICTQVLEHAVNPEILLDECYRVLREDGKIFLTMPFIWNEHEVPYDFRRYTRYGHKKIFDQAGFKIEEIASTCGVFGVCGQLLSAFIFEQFNNRNILLRLLISLFFCFPVQLLFVALDFLFKNSWITLDYIIIAKKKI